MSEWPPRPMTLAESHVEWFRVQRHIDERRAAVERAGVGVTRRIATCVALNGHVRHDDKDTLVSRLQASLDATARFGYRSAQAEVRALRGDRLTLAYELPDVGSQAEVAAGGIDAVRALIKRRATEATDRVVTAALSAYTASQPSRERQAVIVAATRKALHRVVLELVGETLAQGRSAGAMAVAGGPPEFAQRSGMLDRSSCEGCDRLSGIIVQVGSSEYYDYMPPSGCFGGGRCRCVYVFGDTAAHMERPAEAA